MCRKTSFVPTTNANSIYLLLLSLLQLNCFQVRLFTESRTAAATLQEEGGTAADGHMADYAAAAADAVSLEAN